MPKNLVLCDCEATQSIDRDLIERHCDVACSRVHTALCTREINIAAEHIGKGNTIIACQQETAVFDQLAGELGVDPSEHPEYVDIRDRAGWSDDSASSAPKMAAILADSLLEGPPVKTVDVLSDGLCLILGASETVYPAAVQLCETLGVTVLATDDEQIPTDRRFEVIRGDLVQANGSIGRFKVRIRNLQQLEPGGRGDFTLGEPAESGESECDLILDLSGEAPLFPAHHKRDGYIRADPGDPLAVQRAIFKVSHLTGTFEQPLYVRFDEHLCAYSRAGQPACSRCLDVCPTGAISPAGDHVAIDPMICAGCGACSAVCPSGAASHEHPPVGFLFRRLETLVRVYREAGGTEPRLLVHDEDHGAEMISLCARHGRGLPSSVIPLALESITSFGHAEILAALATGFLAVDLLLSPRTERAVLERETAIALAIMDQPRVRLLDIADPEALAEDLFAFEPAASTAATVHPIGGRREVTRLSAKALNPTADEPIELPDGAPYGAIIVDTDACTLCLSCASLCPSGAIGDNPELPQLRFQEDACLQCGLCANICPESAITLQPRLDLSDAALEHRVLKEEEPYSCIECGAPFGVKSTVERIVAQLEGKHSMFSESSAGRLIRMCDDCRIKAQYHSEDNPMQMGQRPVVRTTADYLGGKLNGKGRK